MSNYEPNPDNSTVRCEECGNEFDTARGMKTHYGLVHEGSISGIEKTCKRCGDTFRTPPSKADRRTFCSLECKGDWQSEHVRGEDHHAYSRADCICEHCGEEYAVKKSNADQSRFCSTQCWSEFYHVGNGNNPGRSKERVEDNCDYCGDTISLIPYQVANHERHFCNRTCRGRWMSENIRGEDHHRYTTGESRKDYGPGWDDEKRELVRELYGRACGSCGMPEADYLKVYGRKLIVHHVRLPEVIQDPSVHNAPDNLFPVCCVCHPTWEGIPLRPQHESR